MYQAHPYIAYTPKKKTFRIEILGLPEIFDLYELNRFLESNLQISCNVEEEVSESEDLYEEKLFIPSVYAYFETKRDRDKALQFLSRRWWKGCLLYARDVKESQSPLKRPASTMEDNSLIKKPKLGTPEDEILEIRNRTTPLWNTPYPEQVKLKYEKAKNALVALCKELESSNPVLKNVFKNQATVNSGVPLKVHEMKHLESDCDYYRNTWEFMIGEDPFTGLPSVGLRSPHNHVLPLEDDLKSVPKCLLPIIRTFQIFLRTSGKYVGTFSRGTHFEENWKQLTFRVSPKTEDVMIIVVYNAYKKSHIDIQGVTQKITHFYTSEDSALDFITSFYFQTIYRHNTEPSLTHLMGQKYIEEVLGDVKFQFGPEGYFPVNQWGAELVIDEIKKLALKYNASLLIDLCGRNGTIGLPLSKHFASALIIESSEKARLETMKQAESNDITNCEVVSGNVNYFFSEATKNISQQNVCIIDISRIGLKEQGINLIKFASNINKLIFLTTGDRALWKEFNELVKKLPGLPDEETFVLVEAVPIDVFPHTYHYELIIVFERIKFHNTNNMK